MNITAPEVRSIQAAIRSELSKLEHDGGVTVGIHESEGDHEGGINNAQLGAVLNYGDERGHIPPRPWLEPGVDSVADEVSAILSRGVETGAELLSQVGPVAAAAVQVYLTDLKTPPNATSTVRAKKGKANPLIDTGQLRQSVSYSVQQRMPEEE